MTAAYILTGLRVAKPALASIYQGIGLMQESTAFDEAIEEGEIRGRLQTILLLGDVRFGPPDRTAKSELIAIRDLERLDRLTKSILTAQSWEELLATP